MSFPHVIKGESCIIADQSGSGKTLAYLLPLIQSIRQDELQGLAKSLPQSPRIVILVPTAELASQVPYFHHTNYFSFLSINNLLSYVQKT